MQNLFETILEKIETENQSLKPYKSPNNPHIYCCNEKETWNKITGMVKIPITQEKFNHPLLNTFDGLSCLLFVEMNCEPDTRLNNFISNNEKAIKKYCETLNYQFISPLQLLQSIDDECIRYFHPYANNHSLQAIKNDAQKNAIKEWQQILKDLLGFSNEPIRGFFTFEHNFIRFYPLTNGSENELINNFVRSLFLLIPHYNNINDIHYYIALDNDSFLFSVDMEDTGEMTELLEDVRLKVEKLERMGIERDLILSWLDKPKLSRLVITKDFRIVLPDFDNKEICMPPLAKTLYIFYLKHPNGILFRDLHSYRDELLQIYLTISNREKYNNIIQSIDSLIDPSLNSINENRSRIRSAFVKEFCDSIASHYYITGYGKDTVKKIKIDRTLVAYDF